MGNMKKHSSYNVLYFRVNDEELMFIDGAISRGGSRAGFLKAAAIFWASSRVCPKCGVRVAHGNCDDLR